MNLEITKEFLDQNPNAIFVFGDNLTATGTGGAAKLRGHAQTYGFITKKLPTHDDDAYYTVDEYRHVFPHELWKLRYHISRFPHKTFYISKLGAGLANKHGIYESIIQEGLEVLREHPNVVMLTW